MKPPLCRGRFFTVAAAPAVTMYRCAADGDMVYDVDPESPLPCFHCGRVIRAVDGIEIADTRIVVQFKLRSTDWEDLSLS